jgi:hypothetical protein
MAEYGPALLLLVALFVGFGLAHRNRRAGCAGCDGDCDKEKCDKT